MDYNASGDLKNYLANEFYNINWKNKLDKLECIMEGLKYIHNAKIIHRDFHSGNILMGTILPIISDLGLSKSSTESTNDKEIYGIMPYVAPEILQGKIYTVASDIYSFGMIMWEFMTGRRPFWDKDHDAGLIINICDGLRPPIVTNAPESYIKLMQECWDSDPNKRPTATDISKRLNYMLSEEVNNPTEIIQSLDIGPITINHPGAIYSSRNLSSMIKSVISTIRTISSRSTSGEHNMII